MTNIFSKILFDSHTYQNQKTSQCLIHFKLEMGYWASLEVVRNINLPIYLEFVCYEKSFALPRYFVAQNWIASVSFPWKGAFEKTQTVVLRHI